MPTLKAVSNLFAIHNVIGKGGFAVVLLASRTPKKDAPPVQAMPKPFAIKAIDDAKVKEGGAGGKRRFELEKWILKNLGKECVFLADSHFIIDTPEMIFLITDYYSGGALSFHLRKAKRAAKRGSSNRSTIGEARIRYYALEIALALSFLHSRGILHRDLKPANILLDASGHVKVVDFGTCRDFGKNLEAMEDSKARRRFTKLGTTDYMAPEMLRGKGYAKGADWWSYGIMLFELLFAELPYVPLKDDKLIIAKIISDDIIVYPDNADFGLSDNCLQFMNDILDKNPDTRIGSANNGCETQILSHPWFADWLTEKNIDLGKFARRAYRAPWTPQLDSSHDVKYMNQKTTREVWTLFENNAAPNPFVMPEQSWFGNGSGSAGSSGAAAAPTKTQEAPATTKKTKSNPFIRHKRTKSEIPVNYKPQVQQDSSSTWSMFGFISSTSISSQGETKPEVALPDAGTEESKGAEAPPDAPQIMKEGEGDEDDPAPPPPPGAAAEEGGGKKSKKKEEKSGGGGLFGWW